MATREEHRRDPATAILAQTGTSANTGEESWPSSPIKEECLESGDFCWNETISGLVHTYGLRGAGVVCFPIARPINLFFSPSGQLLPKMR